MKVEYKLKKILNQKEKRLADEVKKRLPLNNGLLLKFSAVIKKYRYNKNTIEGVKRRTTPRMSEQEITTTLSQAGVEIPSMV